MSSTYGGMLEGYPCKRINDRKVSWLQSRAEHAFPSLPVHLVPPSRECPDEAAGAFGPVEVLHSVACVGVFDSTALDPAMDGSTLVVAWFQPTPEVPGARVRISRFAAFVGRSWPRTMSCSSVLVTVTR